MISYEKTTYRTLISSILILTIAASSVFCYRSSTKYKDVFTLILIFLAFFLYICFAEDLTKGELGDTYELMDNPNAKLLDYHVKTALNCCYKGDINDDYQDILEKLVKEKFNAFDFYVVANTGGEPMIELGGDTINSNLKFQDAINALYEEFYTRGDNKNATLFIILRIKSPASENSSNRIYNILNSKFGDRLKEDQSDKYLKYTPDATYGELKNKVVLLISNVGDYALNTESTNEDNLQSIMYSTISISGKDRLQDGFGLNLSHVHVCSHLGMASPDLYNDNNRDFTDCKAIFNNIFSMGIQFIAVNVYDKKSEFEFTECGEILRDEFKNESKKIRSSKSCIEHGEIFARLGYIPKITSEINTLQQNQKAQDLNIKRSRRFIKKNLKIINENQKKSKKFMKSVKRNFKDVLKENDNVRQDMDDLGKDISSTSSIINNIIKKIKRFGI